ncbi:unnamed protein product [Ectocarpus sp. 4 AP-2014]
MVPHSCACFFGVRGCMSSGVASESSGGRRRGRCKGTCLPACLPACLVERLLFTCLPTPIGVQKCVFDVFRSRAWGAGGTACTWGGERVVFDGISFADGGSCLLAPPRVPFDGLRFREG